MPIVLSKIRLNSEEGCGLSMSLLIGMQVFQVGWSDCIHAANQSDVRPHGHHEPWKIASTSVSKSPRATRAAFGHALPITSTAVCHSGLAVDLANTCHVSGTIPWFVPDAIHRPQVPIGWVSHRCSTSAPRFITRINALFAHDGFEKQEDCLLSLPGVLLIPTAYHLPCNPVWQARHVK